MCYPCKCCGKCKPKIAMGLCPICRLQNADDARICVGCGFRFPPKPGSPGGIAESKPPVGMRVQKQKAT